MFLRIYRVDRFFYRNNKDELSGNHSPYFAVVIVEELKKLTVCEKSD